MDVGEEAEAFRHPEISMRILFSPCDHHASENG